MSLQTNNRDFPEVGTALDKVDYQRFEHPEEDLLHFRKIYAVDEIPPGIPFRGDLLGKTYPVSVRIYCPDIRVVSRIAVIFQPKNPADRINYNLSTIDNDIIAYRCMNAGTCIARVGEIIGKQGVPLVFPKSNIDGIAFQNEDDMPWIDVLMNLGFPGYEGKWSVFYHATSSNKLKKIEWQGYISRVTMSIQETAGTITYLEPGD